MSNETETRALRVLAKATADVTGRNSVYRKVQRSAASMREEDYDSAREAFDAQPGETRIEIDDRAQLRAGEDRAAYAAARAQENQPKPEAADKDVKPMQWKNALVWE